MNITFIKYPSVQELLDLHNHIQYLQWENHHQKQEIQDLRNGINAFQEQEVVLCQTIDELQETVNDLQGELTEKSNSLLKYSHLLQRQEYANSNLMMSKTILILNNQKMEKQLKVAEQVMFYTGSLPAYHHQLDPNAADPCSIPPLTIKRSKTPQMNRLKLANSLDSITEEEKAKCDKVNGILKRPHQTDTAVSSRNSRRRVTFRTPDGSEIIAENIRRRSLSSASTEDHGGSARPTRNDGIISSLNTTALSS